LANELRPSLEYLLNIQVLGKALILMKALAILQILLDIKTFQIVDSTMTNMKNFSLSKIVGSVPKIKFGEIKNLLDVLTQYKILGFCRWAEIG